MVLLEQQQLLLQLVCCMPRWCGQTPSSQHLRLQLAALTPPERRHIARQTRCVRRPRLLLLLRMWLESTPLLLLLPWGWQWRQACLLYCRLLYCPLL
jgi:hypothetical protein